MPSLTAERHSPCRLRAPEKFLARGGGVANANWVKIKEAKNKRISGFINIWLGSSKVSASRQSILRGP